MFLKKSNLLFNKLFLFAFLLLSLGCTNDANISKTILGEKLFFENKFSSDGKVSCGTCHQPSLYFTDGLSKSKGVYNRIGKRNAPSLLNIANNTHFNWDGGTNSITTQMLVPIGDFHEMDSSIPNIIEALQNDTNYIQDFKKVWNEKPNAFNFTRSIEAYIQSLSSLSSKYDSVIANLSHFNLMEEHGNQLFFSERLGCNKCHTPPLFTNLKFENNGLYETYMDSGRARVTFKPFDLHLFKVPSLRNVFETAPYMHDGSISTLTEVIEHYNQGGKHHFQKSKIIQPLNLDSSEKIALIAFLKTLTDKSVPEKHQKPD